MTAISEPFTIMTVSNEVGTFADMCVQPGPTATSAVVTHDSMSASLVEIVDDRAVKTRTWHTKLALPFTCPVVYDSTRDRYIAVSRRSVFFLLPEEDGSAKRKTIQLAHVVYRLLPRPNEEPVVLFRDGTFSTLTAASSDESPAGEAMTAGEQIVHVEVGSSDRTAVILIVTRRGSQHRCRLLRLNESNSTPLLDESLDSLLNTHELRSCCLIDGKPVILTSDGAFTSVAGGSVFRQVSRLSEDVSARSVTITALDSQRLLVTMEDRVFVWSLTLQTCEVSRAAKVHQAKVAGKTLYLLCSDLGLCCAPMEVGPTRLCRVVGLGASGPSQDRKSVPVDVEGADEGNMQDLEEMPEEQLVALVQSLLSQKSKEMLDRALRLPYSGDRLRHSLQHETSLDEARALIGYLLSSLESYSLADTVPLQRALDWLCCILDAHLPRLLLADGEEVAALVRRVREATDRVQTLFADLDDVEQCLLLQRVRSLKFDGADLYTIQTIEI